MRHKETEKNCCGGQRRPPATGRDRSLNEKERATVELVISAFDKGREGADLSSEEECLLCIAKRYAGPSTNPHSGISDLEHARKAKVSTKS